MDGSVLLVGLIIFFGIITLISGAWLLARAFIFVRFKMTVSLNSSLNIIKVIRKKADDDNKTREGIQAMEKEEISKMEQLLTSLSGLPKHKNFFHRIMYGAPQLTFEMAVPVDSEQISFFISFPQKFEGIVEKQIQSFFPNSNIERTNDYSIFKQGNFTAVSYMKLKRKNFFPIRTYQYLEFDPLHNITNSLSKLNNLDEGAAIQLTFKKVGRKWWRSSERIAQRMQQGMRLERAASNNILGEMLLGFGNEVLNTIIGVKKEEQQEFLEKDYPNRPFQLTPEEQEVIKQLEAKDNKARFRVNVRILASAKTQERADDIVSEVENAFVQFDDYNLNQFKPVRKKRNVAKSLIYDFIFRNFDWEKSIILSTEEMASIFHFPISTTETPKINWLRAKSAPPPVNIPSDGLLLGYSNYRGTKTDIRLSANDRRRHLYIIGQTGVGKSTFIEEMAKQDCQKNGLCVIDPHGDLIDNILGSIPSERAEDVIYFDPSDIERPFGLNMMEYEEGHPEQRTFVINEMIAIFDKLYDLKQTGGPMFEQYMRNAMLLVMDSPEIGSTLMEVPRVFRDSDFRAEKLRRCKDVTVVDFWRKEAEKAGGEASLENITPYINSKLTTFISNDMMRPIIAQQKSTINFRGVMDQGKILMVNLSKGKIGEINSHLLGMVIVGKLLMAALGRVNTPEKERKDFYLYIDEFQNFTTDSIAQILSEARKYRLCLTIAHQFIGQLSEDISKAVFGNVGSMASFRVGAEDAEFLQKQFAPVFDMNDLINLDNFNCYTKVLINNESSDAFDMKTYPPTEGDPELRESIKQISRFKLGRAREIVEEEIEERFNSYQEQVEMVDGVGEKGIIPERSKNKSDSENNDGEMDFSLD